MVAPVISVLGGVMKILIAIDGSTCSTTALQEIAARPWPATSQFRIISVIEHPAIAYVSAGDYSTALAYEEINAELHRQHEEIVAAALTKLGAVGWQATSVVIEGIASEEIIKEA